MQELTVALSERSYPIRIGQEETLGRVLEAAGVNGALQSGRQGAVVVDAAVEEQHGATLAAALGDLPRFSLRGGEASKDLAHTEEVLDFLSAGGLERSGFLLAVGGGVIGDLAGFAAAVYLRGIDFYQVPTTLLAMVDSSVGGKTGVNLASGKNLVGAFLQPRGVAAWLPFLRTLPEREFAAGMAEVLKYGLLGDASLLHLLEQSGTLHAEAPPLGAIVARCCRLKAEIVAADERETAREGGRALLNLGHTFGHAIENTAGYGTYLHGEAVGIGLCMAARLAEATGRAPAGLADRTAAAVAAQRLPTRLRAPLPVADLLAAMQRDKKVRDRRIRLVLPEEIGSARVVAIGEAEEERLEALWTEFGAGPPFASREN